MQYNNKIIHPAGYNQETLRRTESETIMQFRCNKTDNQQVDDFTQGKIEKRVFYKSENRKTAIQGQMHFSWHQG